MNHGCLLDAMNRSHVGSLNVHLVGTPGRAIGWRVKSASSPNSPNGDPNNSKRGPARRAGLTAEPNEATDRLARWRDDRSNVSELETARYISLTTFKRDGSPVATPVWITGAAGSYVFTTGAEAFKARRLSRNPSVRVQVCDMRGRVAPDAVQYLGTGEIATSPEAVAAAERALSAKYGWQFRANKAFRRVSARMSRRPPRQIVAVQLSLAES